MNGSIKYWKKQAKMNLSGHWGSAIARCTRSWRGNFYRKYTFHTIISRKHTMANGGRTGLCICLFTDCHGLSGRIQLHASEYGS